MSFSAFPAISAVQSRAVRSARPLVVALLATWAVLVATAACAAAEGFPAFSTPDDNCTGEKPQSKLWYHDGTFWAVMRGSEGVALYERVGTVWVRMNFMDAILAPAGQADVKWDGTHLFVLVYAVTPQLFKYTWHGTLRIWQLVSGFPVVLPRPSGSETMVLESDSTGRLWATAEGSGQIMVYWSTSADHRTWSAGLSLESGVSTDDISSVVAFGGDRIGVLWSDQVRDRFGFRVHHDSQDPAVWDSVETVDAGSGFADDHVHLAADGAGRVFAITKDDFDRMQVHRRDAGGAWTTVRDVIAGIGTRGILMLSDADHKAYALYTRWHSGSGAPPDAIEYRVADLDSLQFGPSMPFITDTHDLDNVTGTKQLLPAGTLCAMAGGDDKVWWNGWPVSADSLQPPLAPDNLTATLQTLPMRAQLAWAAPATGDIDGYDVYMSVDGGAVQKLNLDLVPTTTFTHESPSFGQLCYFVRAIDNQQQSATSNTACISYQPIAPPGEPGQVVVTPVVPGTTNGALTLWFEGTPGQTVPDMAGRGNDAHLGSTTGADTHDPVWITGPAGGALRFDGVNDYAHVSDASSLDMEGSFTVEAWIERTHTKRGTIVYKGTSSARTVSLAITAPGAVEFAWDTRAGTSRTLSTAGLTVAPNSGWRHVAAVYDADLGQSRIYVDGTLRMTGVASGQPAVNAAALYVGVRWNSGSPKEPFAGAIDGVRLRAGAHYGADFTPVLNPMAPDAAAAKSVLVQWRPPVSGGPVGSYVLERAENGGMRLPIHTQPVLAPIFTDENAPAAALCYTVTALNAYGDAGVPAAAACLDLDMAPLPEPPHAVTAVIDSPGARARIAWRAPNGGPTIVSYTVYRSQNASEYTLFAATTAPDTAAVDSTLANGTSCYLVRAVDGDGRTSVASESACLEFVAAPTIGAPVSLVATAADSLVPGNATGAVILGFDEGAGQTAFDTSGNANHAVFGTTDATETTDPAWVSGQDGSAVRFDGSNDRLRIADSPSLRLGGSFTVEAWIRRASTGTEDCIASKGDSSRRNFMVMLTADGRIDFTWETTGGSKRGFVSTAAVPDDNWHHIACVYDQSLGMSRIFLDGVLLQSLAETGTPRGSTDPMYIGARLTAGSLKSYFHGTIDLVRAVPAAAYTENFTPPTMFTASSTRRIVRLEWQAPATGTASAYRVYRQQDESTFVAIGPAMLTAMHYIDMSPPAGTACYKVTAIDAASLEGPASDVACAGIVKPQADTPDAAVVQPAALALGATPNPFNPSTTLHFALPQAADVSLVIYDVRGARVATLVRGAVPAGAHSVRWTGRTESGTGAASGVYFARLQADGQARSAKLLLLK